MALYKSAIYFTLFGGIGYVLMRIVTPDEKKIIQKLPVERPDQRSIAVQKRQAIVDVLRGAAEEKEPMYRQTKEQIDATRNEFISKKDK